MKLLFLTLVILIITQNIFAQQNSEEKLGKYSRIVIGAGPMNLYRFSDTGISMNSYVDFALKKWLFLSANLNVGKSGNYNSNYTYFKFYPDFPKDFETNLTHTDGYGNLTNSFTSVGIYALLNPGVNKKLKVVFGPGISYVSWQEVNTSFGKGFKEIEYYKISNRISKSKKIDFGLRIALERHFSNRWFVGISFQGYTVMEKASSFNAILGFSLN